MRARALTVQFRIRFLDASRSIIQEMHADVWNAPGATSLVKGMVAGSAIRMVILNEVGGEVHSESR